MNTQAADDGNQYCRDVVEGRIRNCRYVVQACQRHLDDLDRQNSPGFPFVFDAALGSKFVRFIEKLKHTSGAKASKGEFLILEMWQRWLVVSIFGWLYAPGHPRAGMRRFNRIYFELGRGNGKSLLNSAICLASLTIDGVEGGQVICAGKNAIQSKVVLVEAQQIVRKSPELFRALGVTLTAHEVRQDRTHSRMFAISADKKGSADGKLPSMVSLDELHSHSDRGTYDAMELALAKRDGSLMVCITTAGETTGTVCYEVRTHVTRILERTVIDENTLGAIYTIDPDMDWRDPSSWACANPNLGVSIVQDTLAQLCLKAQTVVSAQNSFKCKHLCVWAGSESSWLDMEIWRKSHDPDLRIENYIGMKCWIGIDAATKSDICAKIYIFPEVIEGETQYAIFSTAYLPQAAVDESRNSQYGGWVITGDITVSEGDVTDFARLEDDLVEDAKLYDVQEIGFDPWQFASSAQRLMSQGANLVEVRPNVANFSAPMKELESLARQGRLRTNSPVLDYCVSNTVCVFDRNDNIFPRKLGNRPENKIDLVVAMITAMARIMVDENSTSVYEEDGRGVLVFG